MTEIYYVITADILLTEQDGLHPEDGSSVFKTYQKRQTWNFTGNTPISKIVQTVEAECDGRVIGLTITEGRVVE